MWIDRDTIEYIKCSVDERMRADQPIGHILKDMSTFFVLAPDE
jgi:hypothetical protein